MRMVRFVVILACAACLVLAAFLGRYGRYDMWDANALSLASMTIDSGHLVDYGVDDVVVVDDDDDDDDRPFLVVHIGPHKTGTTFLQGTLSVESADGILDMDDIYYLGTSMRLFRREDKLPFDLRSVFNDDPFRMSSSSSSLPDLNEDFGSLLSRMIDSNRSGILIHEALHGVRPEYVRALATYTNERWRVVVAMGYRPMHEWLLSRFNQFVRDEYSSSIWPDGTGRDDDDDDDEIGFPPHLRFGLSTGTGYDSYTVPYLSRDTSIFEEVLDVWTEHFDDVRLVDMMDLPSRSDGRDPLLMHFMCEIVPGGYTSNICRRASDLADESGIYHASSEYGMAYQTLATWSWQMHLIDRRLDREFVMDNIRLYHRRRLNETALPVLCPPPADVDVLRNWTIRTDERLFRRTDHHDQESLMMRSRKLLGSFEKWIHRNRFCTVDVSILLHDDWKPLIKFFAKSARRRFGSPERYEAQPQ
ncbi:hypothetical protein ACHAXA_003682 [Cyclostephanos tholiformis]|uniref:Uncharacterized protein n=1 Tax=Cyclostephanos tholiformis TaxID=382380 RepID=A0ABD3SPF9_9STRA